MIIHPNPKERMFRLKLTSLCFIATLILLQSVMRYITLTTNIFDFGIFQNNFFNVSFDFRRAVVGHFQPFLLIVGPIYRSLPVDTSAFALVISQGICLVLSIFVTWRFFGFVPALALALYYPFWVQALFDIHFDFLVIPILLLFFILCEKRRFFLAMWVAAVLPIVKEPFALQSVGCGLYLWYLAFKSPHETIFPKLLCGLALAIWGCLYFYVITVFVIPYFSGDGLSGLDLSAFSWLGVGVIEKLKYIIFNPLTVVLEIALNLGKIKYLLLIFGLLGFIPLLRPSALIVAVPILMISLLAKHESYYNIGSHYTAGVIVPAIVAFKNGLCVVRQFQLRYSLRPRLLELLLVVVLFAGHWAFASSPFSRLFWSDKVWSYSRNAYIPSDRDFMIKEAIQNHVSDNFYASVSAQNTVNWWYLAHRQVYLAFPAGISEPHIVWNMLSYDTEGLLNFIGSGIKPVATHREVYADYVVIDMKRPWFHNDLGCTWIYGACQNQAVAESFLLALRKTRQLYELVFERDGFMIFRRKL